MQPWMQHRTARVGGSGRWCETARVARLDSFFSYEGGGEGATSTTAICLHTANQRGLLDLEILGIPTLHPYPIVTTAVSALTTDLRKRKPLKFINGESLKCRPPWIVTHLRMPTCATRVDDRALCTAPVVHLAPSLPRTQTLSIDQILQSERTLRTLYARTSCRDWRLVESERRASGHVR